MRRAELSSLLAAWEGRWEEPWLGLGSLWGHTHVAASKEAAVSTGGSAQPAARGPGAQAPRLGKVGLGGLPLMGLHSQGEGMCALELRVPSGRGFVAGQ